MRFASVYASPCAATVRDHPADNADVATYVFGPQGVSNVAWALATAGHHDEVLFEKLLAHCLADIGAYDVQVRQRSDITGLIGVMQE